MSLWQNAGIECSFCKRALVELGFNEENSLNDIPR